MNEAEYLFWLEMNWEHVYLRKQWGNLEAEQIFAALWSQSKTEPIRKFNRRWSMTSLLHRRIQEYITVHHRSIPFRVVQVAEKVKML